MGEQLKKVHGELSERLKKFDEALLELLKQGHRELITQTIKDYLSSLE